LSTYFGRFKFADFAFFKENSISKIAKSHNKDSTGKVFEVAGDEGFTSN
jgi:hypothetical protein